MRSDKSRGSYWRSCSREGELSPVLFFADNTIQHIIVLYNIDVFISPLINRMDNDNNDMRR